MNSYEVLTLKVDQVLSLGQLFLRWPYNTVEKVARETIALDLKTKKYELELYRFIDMRYDPGEGFFLLLAIHGVPSPENFETFLELFPNLFVLRQDVEKIEQGKREYTLYPAGKSVFGDDALCTRDNVNTIAPQVLYKCCHYGLENMPAGQIAEHALSSINIWPWLGPVDPPLSPQELKRTVAISIAEMRGYVAAAKAVGQQEDEYLARMLKYRYPELTYTELVRAVDGNDKRKGQAITRQARRWLGKE